MAVKKIDSHTVYRPIQYLGTKIRSLPMIADAYNSLTKKPETALDLFTGSSVVAQFLKNSGTRVIGNDILKFSATLATATLADFDINREINDFIELFDSLDQISDLPQRVQDLAICEFEAIESKNSQILIELNDIVSQLWRGDYIESLSQLPEEQKNRQIFSLLYSGTYFGFNQAIKIDQLRNRISALRHQGKLTLFEESIALTALLSAMSMSVFSAGKHFAQPHLIREDKDQSFVSKRIIEDRSIDISVSFKQSLLDLLNYRKNDLSNGSKSQNSSLEAMLQDEYKENFDLIYVDPPYTAQQYSRFYHIPEVAVSNQFPDLQLVRGEVTRGLYPANRFKSRFCSKRQSIDAFEDVFRLGKKCNASLIISYSLSKTNTTGNERMISLEHILKLAKQYYGRSIELVEFDHVYRQFNHSNLINSNKEDKEIQILCKKN